ncbi:MAG: hypothetical protein LBL37_03905, partial [Gracilibacteraceae bacterium]|nr:hypothetical protein [Gracilibacteraceae bacterium]
YGLDYAAKAAVSYLHPAPDDRLSLHDHGYSPSVIPASCRNPSLFSISGTRLRHSRDATSSLLNPLYKSLRAIVRTHKNIIYHMPYIFIYTPMIRSPLTKHRFFCSILRRNFDKQGLDFYNGGAK